MAERESISEVNLHRSEYVFFALERTMPMAERESISEVNLHHSEHVFSRFNVCQWRSGSRFRR